MSSSNANGSMAAVGSGGGPGGPRGELQVVREAYEFVLELARRVEVFPRHHRHGLGVRLEERARLLLRLLIQAKYAHDRIGSLSQANIEIELLRFELRLARDLGVLPHRGQEHLVRLSMSIGRQIGGWLGHATAGAGAAAAAPVAAAQRQPPATVAIRGRSRWLTEPLDDPPTG